MSPKMNWVAAFVLGLAFGAAAMAGVSRFAPWCAGARGPRPFDAQRLLDRFTRKLDLNADQKSKVEKILVATQQRMQNLKDQTWPQFKEIRQNTQTEIRSLLTPEQQTKFDRMCQEHEKRMEAWHQKGGQR